MKILYWLQRKMWILLDKRARKRGRFVVYEETKEISQEDWDLLDEILPEEVQDK